MVADGLHRWAEVSGTLEYRLFTRFVSAKFWNVNAEDSSKGLIHARQLVPAGAVYLLSPQYYNRAGESNCTANTTEAPIHF